MKLILQVMTILILQSSAVAQTPKRISCTTRNCNGTLIEVFDAIRAEMEKPAPRLANIFSPTLQQQLRQGGAIETSIRTQDAYTINEIEVRPFTLGRHGMINLHLSYRDEGSCLERAKVKKHFGFTDQDIFTDAADPPPPRSWGYKKKYSSATIYVSFSDGPANCAKGLSIHLGE